MEVNNLTIVWHDNNEPVYSAHFQPNFQHGASQRLVTGGGDNNVRIWKLLRNKDDVKVEYLSTLTRHTQAVNVVRFDPKGEILATAGDDGTVLIWTLNTGGVVKEFGSEEDDELKESWTLRHSCRSSTSEIYDLAWSPDSKFIITGSTDNVSRIYDASTGQQVSQIAEHNHYVQGVCWDPLGQFVATQSADRSIHIYSLHSNPNDSVGISPKIHHKISRAELPTRLIPTPASLETSTPGVIEINDADETETTKFETPPVITTIQSPKQSRSVRSASPLPAIRAQVSHLLNFNSVKSSMLYHTENLESFFRRLTFSPDGNFLLTPSGIFKNSTAPHANDNKEDLTNTVYIYSRTGLNKPPIAHLPGFKKAALVIAFSPVFYELDPGSQHPAFKLPYKMVYAVATQDSVFIYDTQHEHALGSVSSIHYRILTDITWNADGESLIVSSADGFCTLIRFSDGEFGNRFSKDYSALLPESTEEITTSMVSPALKKRSGDFVVNELTPSKKGRIDSLIVRPIPNATNTTFRTTVHSATLAPVSLSPPTTALTHELPSLPAHPKDHSIVINSGLEDTVVALEGRRGLQDEERVHINQQPPAKQKKRAVLTTTPKTTL